MDEELKSYLESMEARIVDRTTERLAGRIDASEDRMKRQLAESLTNLETKMLKAFHAWGRPYEIRQRTVEAIVHGFDERVGLIEERISELERGKDAA